MAQIVEEVPGLFRVVLLNELRRTPGVFFDTIPLEILPRIDAVDRVLHEHGARSPGPLDDVAAPWYMHPHQDDDLIVLHGTRRVELYQRSHGRVEVFLVEPNRIERNGALVVDGPAMLVWPASVFHRIVSSARTGSASLNFAVHHEGFDLRTNFNIYDVRVDDGTFRVVREGHLDQPSGV